MRGGGVLKRFLQLIDGIKAMCFLLKAHKGDYVAIRYPFNKIITAVVVKLKHFFHYQSIVIIEDANFIRYGQIIGSSSEFDRCIYDLSRHDILMAPNQAYLDVLNVCKCRKVNFYMYPYSIPGDIQPEIQFKNKTICFAGNLEKSQGFLKQLNLQTWHMGLFGKCNEELHLLFGDKYRGCLTQQELAQKLVSYQYGLVWDGSSLDIQEDETGLGRYLRWNTPNKLCLYLALGIPVIVWKDSAMADYISKHKCGILVASLNNIEDILNDISEIDYLEMRYNAQSVSADIRSGYDLMTALQIIKDGKEE